jgi:Domain of unknown function (DUF4136)
MTTAHSKDLIADALTCDFTNETINETKDKTMKSLKQILFPTIISGIFLLACGCQSTPNVTHKPGVDFTQYQTFAFADFNRRGPVSDPTAPLRLRRAVQTSLSETLAHKGYTEVKSDTADFLVKVYGNFIPDEPGVNSLESRTSVIEIIDAKTKEVVWSTSRTRMSSTTLTPEAAGQLAARMIEPFPTGEK